ncbi:hypothetical protein ACFFIX_20375 [Metabacillus herbersteinensis]|uniref:Uncharacterized protein n=1 Tax=Metabacillus herbersteinensis TaxID=283816 RepID=A0ABV6GJ65_9BACI
MKTLKNKSFMMFLAVLTLTIVSYTVVPESASAWSKAGITENSSIDNSGIYDDLDSIVTFIMILGGFWVLIMLIIGGMLLSGSNGNPQRRSAGLVSLASSFGGGWVIIKAYDIAGWISGFGA